LDNRLPDSHLHNLTHTTERSYRPEGIEARIAHGRRHLAKQRREKADAAFLKGILNGH
jgi:hypothetical protein